MIQIVPSLGKIFLFEETEYMRMIIFTNSKSYVV